MPELPEVETTVRGLAHVLKGARLARVEPRRGDLRRPFPEGLAQALTGARVTHLSRRAKYGVIHTDRDRALVFHLGMSGRWRIDPSERGMHDHLVIETDKGARVSLCDPRRFGSVDLVDEAGLDAWPAFAALGPEPLGEGLTAAHLATVFKGRKPAVKIALLDQRNVAGLGNIYVCEALFRAGLSPFKPAARLATKTAKPTPAARRLVPQIKSVLQEAIRAGGSTLRDYKQADGSIGAFQNEFQVYGREGEPCSRPSCRGRVRRKTQGGRSTFYCPVCQR